MAKICAHGTEIGTVYFTTSAQRYMSDGAVLINTGFGWKLGGRLKGETPQAALARQVEKQRAFLADRPALAAYRKELHALAGLGKRWKLHAAIQLMPDDADGVWSSVCDGYGDNIHSDVDEIGHLCHLYQYAIAEAKRLKKEAAPCST